MPAFAVACGHDLTADAAAETLRAGGTAVDAAVAAALVAMVAEPVLAGLLGGGFLMVRLPGRRARLLDFFVQTPRKRLREDDLDFRSIHADFGTATQEFHIGAGTIATPGVAPGLVEAHRHFGRIPFAELVEPACIAARQGVRVSAFQARLLAIVEAICKATPGAQALFCDGDRPLAEGAVFRNPDFAEVLEEYAREGPRFVAEGEVAAALLAATDQGGHLTAEDLRRYRPAWRMPLMAGRGGARVSLNPPPALGGALIAFGLDAMPKTPDPVTLLAGIAATGRARIEAALDDDPEEGALRLAEPGLVARYRREIAGRPASVRGTTHISVIDADGMGAALTLSNGEGAGMVLPGTGLMPNNMMGEADLLPGGFHAWETDRRMASMMAPLLIEWPDRRFALMGSGGSNRIRSALLQVLLGLTDRGLDLVDAIEAPRLHVEGIKEPQVDFEDVGGEAFRAAILDAAPEATVWPERSMFFGGVHAALGEAGGGLRAVGDPRRAGVSRTD